MDLNMEIALRAPELADVDMMYRLENSPEVAGVSWGQGPVSRQMLWAYVNEYSADPLADHQMRFVIEADGVAAGCIDVSDIDMANRRAFLGIGLERAFRGRGIALEAVRQAARFCREDLGLHQLAVIVPRSNEASMRLFEKAGFKTCGCLRSWVRVGANSYADAIVLQLLFSTTG